MKYSVAIVAAVAALANAQSACLSAANGIPACALGYIASAASAGFQCGLVDFQCQCSNSAAVQSTILQPVASACGGSAGDVLSAVGAVCSCANANAGDSISLDAVQSACQPSAAAIPPCALGYIADTANSAFGCALYDFACQCSNSAAIQQSILQPVASACGGGAGDVLSAVGSVCACVSSNGGSGGSGGASATGGASGSSGATATGGSAGGSAPAATGASSAPAATGGASIGHQSAASTPAFSTFTGGAAVPAVGGVLAALGGLVAML